MNEILQSKGLVKVSVRAPLARPHRVHNPLNVVSVRFVDERNRSARPSIRWGPS